MKLFETSVIGSLPRPAWILDAVHRHENGVLSDKEFTLALDEAIPVAITLQEAAGIDVITDGEWRRKSYIQGFSRYVDGFVPNAIEVTVLDGTKRYWPAIGAKMHYRDPIAVDEVTFVMGVSARKVKATLPSPYMIERWFFDPDVSYGAYPTREALIMDAASILRQEILNLAATGVDTIQFDDAMIGRLIGTAYNASGLNPKVSITLADRERELELAVAGINAAVEGVKGVRTAIHICRGHRSRRHVAQGSFAPLLGAVRQMNIDIIAMEFASEDISEIDILRDFPKQKMLGLGAIDVLSESIDPPERVMQRVEKAMRFVEKERITLNPDCGFAPSSENPITLREAFYKMKSLADAAERLRLKHHH